MEVKDVLDNFAPDERVEALKYAIWEALTTLQNDRYATRAQNAMDVLENALLEYGYPDSEEG